MTAHAQQTDEAGTAEQPAVFAEPIFGVAYSPAAVHFEPVPDSVHSACYPNYEHEYVFAHVKSGKTDYYVISGYSDDQDGDSLGYIAMVVGATCDTYDMQSGFHGVRPEGGYPPGSLVEIVPGKDAPDVPDPGVSAQPGNYHYVFRSAHEEWVVRSLIRDSFQRALQAFDKTRQNYVQQVCSPSKLAAFSDFCDRVSREELQRFCSSASQPQQTARWQQTAQH